MHWSEVKIFSPFPQCYQRYCYLESHRGFRGVASQDVRLQLELGDASEVALPASNALLEVDTVHSLLVHVGHVLYEPHADRRRKITDHALQNNMDA